MILDHLHPSKRSHHLDKQYQQHDPSPGTMHENYNSSTSPSTTILHPAPPNLGPSRKGLRCCCQPMHRPRRCRAANWPRRERGEPALGRKAATCKWAPAAAYCTRVRRQVKRAAVATTWVGSLCSELLAAHVGAGVCAREGKEEEEPMEGREGGIVPVFNGRQMSRR